MMMSKPKSEATSTSTTSSVSPSAATTSPADAVADLERRLADLSAATPVIPQSTAVQSTTKPAPVTQAASNPAVSSKNALLVSALPFSIILLTFVYLR